MSLINSITEKLILPASDIVLGQNIKKHLNFLEDSQWWSLSQLEDYQNAKLRNLIKHAYENVPYYREIMKSLKLVPCDIQTKDDLKKLPVLTKDVFKKNFPHKLTAQNISPNTYRFDSSSGSTGKPIQLYLSKDAYGFNKACNLRGWYWMGYRLGDKIVKISQNKRSSKVKSFQDRFNHTLLFPQSYTRENFLEFIEVLDKFSPKFLRSYPDPLLFLSRMAEEEGIKLPSMEAINTTGNMLFDNVRELAEQQFGSRIYDSYSCEGNPNLFECSSKECYHSSMEYGIIELLNENGEDVGPGEEGRLFSTDLHNYATPFIRYDTQDVLIRHDKECSCGRKLIPIKRIIGRDNDILITKDRQYLIGQTFTTYFKRIYEIKQFQIVQQEIDLFEFRLVVTEEFNKEIENRIVVDWKGKIGADTKITVSVVSEIPLLSSGKRRFLIRNKDIKLKL